MTDLISKGRHAAVPRSIQFGRAGADDKPQVVVLFEIVGNQDPFAGWTITAFLFLSEGAFDRSVESLGHMGWQGDDLTELPALCENGQLGEVDIVIDHEEYNGEVHAKVKWVNRRGGGGIQVKKPIEGHELQSFAAQMRGRIKASRGGDRSRPSAPSQRSMPSTGRAPHPNAPGGDDIPF